MELRTQVSKRSFKERQMRTVLGMVMTLLATCFAGCENAYVTPGGRADFAALGLTASEKAALTDGSVQALLEKKPLVQFPAAIAVARVQAVGYFNYGFRQAGAGGRYSVITVRDIETDEDFKTFAALPKVKGVGTIKKILLDGAMNSDLELRNAAAKIHADLLLYYTFDTEFHSQNSAAPLSLISLGVFPTEVAKVTCTASAVLIDVNNGYVYSVVEATASNDQLANAWTSAEAADQVRRKTEREAFGKMVKDFCGDWSNVLKNYDRGMTAKN
jgi:hypothetical protein